MILFQTDDFYVCEKPAGVSFNDEADAQGWFNQLKAHTQEVLYPVHRLDKVTSGLIIVARHVNAAAEFTTLFTNKCVEKIYLAMSDQKPKKKQGWVKGDMEKSRRGSWKLLRSQNAPAVTQFHSEGLVEGKRLFWVSPKTGKTHQIRVALKSIGAPIFGDPVYGSANQIEAGQPDRCYLHAFALQFEFAGECYRFALLPNDGSLFQLASLQERLHNWIKAESYVLLSNQSASFRESS
ncbi:TIGR01621 family pseudouridine synthase [Algicola sagamiensis]|uniref:TIGR01621 family pseudouridine synthase n=1 Tax=Algicola sagamiensis TaxID=163869 RepID=UPI00037C3DD5|nr:TIGR01621 family pseudouridine synthase [Algicola sagamiensis]